MLTRPLLADAHIDHGDRVQEDLVARILYHREDAHRILEGRASDVRRAVGGALDAADGRAAVFAARPFGRKLLIGDGGRSVESLVAAALKIGRLGRDCSQGRRCQDCQHCVFHVLFLPLNIQTKSAGGTDEPSRRAERYQCLPTVLIATIDIFWLTLLLTLLFCCTWNAPAACAKAWSSIWFIPTTVTPVAVLPVTMLLRLASSSVPAKSVPSFRLTAEMAMFCWLELLTLAFCCTWNAPLACSKARSAILLSPSTVTDVAVLAAP